MEYIVEVLERQNTALRQLMEYMKQEYALLQAGKPEPLAEISFAMQDCIHSIESERIEMLGKLGKTIQEYSKSLSEENARKVTDLLRIIESQEHACKEQSEYNRAIAMGMIEQCRKNIEFIQENMATHTTHGYMPSGALQKTIVQGTLLEGRL